MPRRPALTERQEAQDKTHSATGPEPEAEPEIAPAPWEWVEARYSGSILPKGGFSVSERLHRAYGFGLAAAFWWRGAVERPPTPLAPCIRPRVWLVLAPGCGVWSRRKDWATSALERNTDYCHGILVELPSQAESGCVQAGLGQDISFEELAGPTPRQL